VDVKPLRHHGLIDLAGRDLFLNLPDGRLELLARVVRLDGQVARFGPPRARQVALQLPLEEVDLGAREVIERAEILPRPQPRAL
jgi:hypothetical protein